MKSTICTQTCEHTVVVRNILFLEANILTNLFLTVNHCFVTGDAHKLALSPFSSQIQYNLFEKFRITKLTNKFRGSSLRKSIKLNAQKIKHWKNRPHNRKRSQIWFSVSKH